MSNNYELARLLLEFGADVDFIGRYHDNIYKPVVLTFSEDRLDIFEMLLEKGASPDVILNGNTLLSALCGHTRYFNDKKQELRCLNALLNARKSPEFVKNWKQTIGKALEEKKDNDFVSTLLSRYEKLPKESDVVACALYHGHPDFIVERLIEKGADVNVPYVIPKMVWLETERRSLENRDGGKKVAALWLAVVQGRPRIVELLLRNGADANWRNGKGMTVKELPCTEEIREMIRTLGESKRWDASAE